MRLRFEVDISDLITQIGSEHNEDIYLTEFIGPDWAKKELEVDEERAIVNKIAWLEKIVTIDLRSSVLKDGIKYLYWDTETQQFSLN